MFNGHSKLSFSHENEPQSLVVTQYNTIQYNTTQYKHPALLEYSLCFICMLGTVNPVLSPNSNTIMCNKPQCEVLIPSVRCQ